MEHRALLCDGLERHLYFLVGHELILLDRQLRHFAARFEFKAFGCGQELCEGHPGVPHELNHINKVSLALELLTGADQGFMPPATLATAAESFQSARQYTTLNAKMLEVARPRDFKRPRLIVARTSNFVPEELGYHVAAQTTVVEHPECKGYRGDEDALEPAHIGKQV